MNRLIKLSILLFLLMVIWGCTRENPDLLNTDAAVVLNFESPENEVLDKYNNRTSAIDKLEIVFYDIGVDIVTIIDNYHEYYDELQWESPEGDQTNFDDYWLAYDESNMDILTNGRYRIEERKTVVVDSSSGYVNTGFYLSQGVKSCRVGFYSGGQLTYVGQAYKESYEGDSYENYFSLSADDTTYLYVSYYPVEVPELQGLIANVVINTPPDQFYEFVGEPISFTGEVYDRDNNILDSQLSLSWQSSLDGTIGSAKTLQISSLQEGIHLITFTAINTENPDDYGYAEITITIIE